MKIVAAIALLAAAGTSLAAETVRVESDGVTLVGSLRLPEGEGPFPVVILTHGSEPGRRENPGYVRWAERLRARGIAALSSDKRGCGDSGGTYVEAPDLTVSAVDLNAWARYLASRPEIRGAAIGTLGWSQGGWVGPLAAQRGGALAFVVSVSGPGVSPLEQNIYDKANRFRRSGADPRDAERFERAIDAAWRYLATGEQREEAEAAWAEVADEPWFASALDGPPMGDRERILAHPRMKHWLVHTRYDPLPALEGMGVPLLAVFGGDDPVVPVEASVAAMRAAFRRAGNDGLTIRVYPGGDHGVRVDGQPAAGFIDETLAWIVEQASR